MTTLWDNSNECDSRRNVEKETYQIQ